MTSGFEQQRTCANLGFIRSNASPKPKGVTLPKDARPAPAQPPRPADPLTL